VRSTVLGRTGLELSRVGFGAWALGGGGWEWGWGAQSDEESVAAIHRALELGVDWIDTAAQYGFGHSERVVGRALVGIEPRPYVFTKCSQLEGPDGKTVHSLKRDSVRRECEGSLERLGIDAIDLYQIHFPIPDDELEEGWSTLAELRAEGLVRHIGASNFSVSQLERCERIAPVETLQPPYSLLDRGIEDGVLPWCEERDVGVLVYSPMASGLLTGRMTRERVESLPEDDWRRHDARFRGERLDQALSLVERLRTIGDAHGAPPGAVAVAWTLAQPGVDLAIVGFRGPDQVEDLLPAAAELELTPEQLDELGR
jgi:aryl-alcohol dehydrogenase-like predicted oxidoreductase